MKIGRALLPSGKTAVVEIVDDSVRELVGASADELVSIAMTRTTDGWVKGEACKVPEARFLSPIVRPTSIRDFSAFEQHTKNCVEGLGGMMNPLWYEFPVFYFSNPNCVTNDGDVIHPPKSARSIDYELEFAGVIGRSVKDCAADDPAWTENIAGFMLMNDWSARDLGSQELKLFMGPAKAKDFATSFGPWLVTPDELAIDGNTVNLPLIARVNGKEFSRGDVNQLFFDWPTIIARASADAELVPGDVIGTGTCGSGCLIELRLTGGKELYPWLTSGDRVELEAPGLGILSNTIA